MNACMGVKESKEKEEGDASSHSKCPRNGKHVPGRKSTNNAKDSMGKNRINKAMMTYMMNIPRQSTHHHIHQPHQVHERHNISMLFSSLPRLQCRHLLEPIESVPELVDSTPLLTSPQALSTRHTWQTKGKTYSAGQHHHLHLSELLLRTRMMLMLMVQDYKGKGEGGGGGEITKTNNITKPKNSTKTQPKGSICMQAMSAWCLLSIGYPC